MLLIHDAVQWSENHPDAARLLTDITPTQSTVENFCVLFCERFPSKTIEVTPVSFDVELACLFVANLKHAYYTIPLHLEDRHYFAFTISGIGQLQHTRMQQGS